MRWVCLVYVQCASLYVAFRARLDSKILNMLKIFLEARPVPGVCLINTFRISSRRVTGALNTFGARFRHTSARYMRVPISRDTSFFSSVPQACVRRALNVCCSPIARA